MDEWTPSKGSRVQILRIGKAQGQLISGLNTDGMIVEIMHEPTLLSDMS